MEISIFGLGYVGCVSLACLSKNGHHITAIDINPAKVDAINNGISPIVEKDVDILISEQKKANTIEATANTQYTIDKTEVSIICVGTPSTHNGHLNLDAIFKVANEIGEALKSKQSFHTIAIRSTVLPGTNEKVSQIIEQTSGKTRNEDFAVVSNPEFLREGTAVKDFYEPPYTLLGSHCEAAIEVMRRVYAEIQAEILVTDIKIAEIIKYVNNAFHATKIIFANEIGNICKKLDINSHKLMELFFLDKKLNISPYYLKPGFAYGGSCLPKDLKALHTIAHDHYIESPLLESIHKSNENQKHLVYEKIIGFEKSNIGFLGLSFKAGTDDLRNSPIIDIIERLLGKGFNVRIFDENVHFSQLMGANKEYILKKIPYISRFVTDKPDDVNNESEVVVVVHNTDKIIKSLSAVSDELIVLDLVNLNDSNLLSHKYYEGLSW